MAGLMGGGAKKSAKQRNAEQKLLRAQTKLAKQGPPELPEMPEIEMPAVPKPPTLKTSYDESVRKAGKRFAERKRGKFGARNTILTSPGGHGIA